MFDFLVLFWKIILILVSLSEYTVEVDLHSGFKSRWIERNGTYREFAHVVYIKMEKASDGICSGSLIHERWVLTAARCLYENKDKVVETDTSLTLYAPVEDTNNLTSEKVQVRKSRKVRVHELSGNHGNYYSLALVQVDRPFERKSQIIEDAMVTGNGYGDVKDKVCKVGGFGYTAWDKPDNVMKCQEVDYNATCPCKSKLVKENPEFHGEWFCGKSSVGICRGDFGAGLICDETVQAVAVGLVEVDGDACDREAVMDSRNCGGDRTLAIYADVCYHLEWIRVFVPTVELNTTVCRGGRAAGLRAWSAVALAAVAIAVKVCELGRSSRWLL